MRKKIGELWTEHLIEKNLIDNHYKTMYGQVRTECSYCRLFNFVLKTSQDSYVYLERNYGLIYKSCETVCIQIKQHVINGIDLNGMEQYIPR